MSDSLFDSLEISREVLDYFYDEPPVFNLEEFEAALVHMNGGVVLRTSSTDERFHVITYVRDRSSSVHGVRPLFTTRIFRDGVVPDHHLDDFASEDQALDLHDSLVESHLSVYENAPCLMDGAL
jgi:hypothetical protein